PHRLGGDALSAQQRDGRLQLAGGERVERVGGRGRRLGGHAGTPIPGTPAGVIEIRQCSLNAFTVPVSRIPRSAASPSIIGWGSPRSGTATTRPPSSAESLRGRAFTIAYPKPFATSVRIVSGCSERIATFGSSPASPNSCRK